MLSIYACIYTLLYDHCPYKSKYLVKTKYNINVNTVHYYYILLYDSHITINDMLYIVYYNRGEGFRPAFAKLGEVRSIVGQNVPFVAMTATAEERTKNKIIELLHLKPPICIEASPDRVNIFYGILKSATVRQVGLQLAKGLEEHGDKYPKTLVFCRK